MASGDDAAKKYTQEYTGIKCFKSMARKAHRKDSHVYMSWHMQCLLVYVPANDTSNVVGDMTLCAGESAIRSGR